ncbi:hypothetical protein EPI10_027766 [Gossypium australe]|uniref:Retrovirus-related Pol polyprotein from transposon opus n=1 Tax=Gossypium australe TaxID=47621 RepID=A0A5B6UUS0_9ROSI|nr:hypothetical protein EPI10_027766 [Gossypium australe]
MELIEKVPKYAKFLKEMMARGKKNKCNYFQTSTTKIERPGSIHFTKALCNLGAINLMPLLIFEKLGLGNLKETQITLQLADRSSVHLERVLEDVCKALLFLRLLDFKEDREIPILLGRPFLAISRSTIDLEKNDLTMKINGETETFRCGYQLNKEIKGALQKFIYF